MVGMIGCRVIGKLVALVCTLLLTSSLHAVSSLASKFPLRPVRIIVPFTPGASVDVVGRIIAAKLQDFWHQPVVVENHPGAGSTIGARFVAEGSSDGYDLLFTLSDTFTVLPHLADYQSFHPMKVLVPINLLAILVDAIVANPSVPANDLPGLITYARAHPGTLRYGSPGVGTNIHLSMEMLKSMAKINIQHIPYRGLEPAVTATLGGVVQITQAGYSARDLIDSGRLKILAVAGPKRFAAFPNVLTTADVGYPKVDSSSWLMMAAPVKTPTSTLAKIDDDLSRVLHDSSVLTQLVEARGLIISNIRRSDAPDQLNRQSRDRAEAVQIAGLNK